MFQESVLEESLPSDDPDQIEQKEILTKVKCFENIIKLYFFLYQYILLFLACIYIYMFHYMYEIITITIRIKNQLLRNAT